MWKSFNPELPSRKVSSSRGKWVSIKSALTSPPLA
jgi:hypothetical protein